MYHVSTQGIDERMINVHYYYYALCQFLYCAFCSVMSISVVSCQFLYCTLCSLVSVSLLHFV